MDKSSRIGDYVITTTAGEEVRAYVPPPLPPVPDIDLDSLSSLLAEANLSLGRLDAVGYLLPDISIFIYSYIRKEAVLSSQIEGTQSSLSDLMEHEINNLNIALDDVQEVSSYVSAMNYALSRLEKLPLSNRLLREIHGKLMDNSRGKIAQPGEFRRSQNWIGGTSPSNARFVPPPVAEMQKCLGDLEKFIHNESYSPLIKIAMAHVQFETIHPFLDGNGRLGRLLITLMLCSAKILHEPILYLSLYFKLYRQEYYDRLQAVRMTGDWEAWINFFLRAVIYCSEEAYKDVRKISQLFEVDKNKIIELKKANTGLLQIFDDICTNPITKSTHIEKKLGFSKNTALRRLRVLVKLGILQERPSKKVPIFIYSKYLEILNKDTEL